MKTMSTLWSFCAFLTLVNLANTQQINGATCQLPIDPGNCGVLSVLSTPTVRYGYDRATGRCIQFTYSGCGGNTNRFTSYNQCLTSCFSSQQLSLNDIINLVGYVFTGQSSINSLVATTTCNKTIDADTSDIEEDDYSDSEDVFGLDLNIDQDICDLPIDEGDCRNESLDTNEDGDSESDNGIDKLYELNDLNELINPNASNEYNKSNESNTFYFGYNKSTKKCEQFNYSGCGGNDNNFDTVNECRKTCYTPLKNFLAKVTDLLVFRVTNGKYVLPAT